MGLDFRTPFADARKVHVQAADDEHYDDDADDVSLPGLEEDDSDDEVPVDTDSSDRAAAPRLPSCTITQSSFSAGRREASAGGI